MNLQLDEVEPTATRFSATVAAFLPAIRAEGLIRRRRDDVHLSGNRETATRIGVRRGRPVVQTADSAGMHAAGHPFFVSARGVWPTDHVPELVDDRRTASRVRAVEVTALLARSSA